MHWRNEYGNFWCWWFSFCCDYIYRYNCDRNCIGLLWGQNIQIISFMKRNLWGYIKRRESRNEVLAFLFLTISLLKRARMQLMLTSKQTLIQAQELGFNQSLLRKRITRCFSHSIPYHPILPVSFGMVTSPFSTAVKASSRTWSAWSSCCLVMTSGGWKRRILPARVIITTPCAKA